ncbi:MAG: WG repeat-containing protein [Cytophagales bacterium]
MFKLFIPFFLVCVSAFSQKPQGQSCPEDLFPAFDKETKLFGYMNFGNEWLVPPAYLKAYPFVGNKAIVQKGSKLGIINCKGFLVVDAIYEDFKPFNFDKIWVRQNGLWGLLNDKGQLLVRPTFNEVQKICNECDQVWVRKENKWALFSEKSNKMLILPTFPEVRSISEWVSLVELDDSIGVIENQTGKYIMKPNLLKVIKMNKHFAFKTKLGKWGVMGSSGNTTVEPIYDSIVNGENNLLIVKKDSKWGLIDFNSKLFLKLVFDKIDTFSDGQAVCVYAGKYGLINRSGKMFFNPDFDFVSRFKGGVSLAKINNKWGLIDKGGNHKSDFIYDDAKEIENGDLIVFKKDNMYNLFERISLSTVLSGLYAVDSLVNNKRLIIKTNQGYAFFDLDLKQIQPSLHFQSVKPALKNHLIVKNEGKWGLLQRDGKPLLNYEFDSLWPQQQEGNLYFLVKKGKKIGVFDHNGVSVLPVEYEFISVESSKTFKAKKNGNFAVLNAKGENLTDFKYQKLSNQIDDPGIPSYPAVFFKGKKSGLLSVSGQELISEAGDWFWLGEQLFVNKKDNKFEIYKNNGTLFSNEKFDSVRVFSGDLVPAKKDARWGYLSLGGKWAMQPQFDEVGDFHKGWAVVKKNGKYGVISQQSKWLIQPEYDGYFPSEKVMTKSRKKYKLTENGLLKPLL